MSELIGVSVVYRANLAVMLGLAIGIVAPGPIAMAQTAPQTGPAANAVANVTTTGGTTGYLPRFSGTAALVNSEIYDTGTTVGIGVGSTPEASARLDLGGSLILRGDMIVSRTSNAYPGSGYPSHAVQFFANTYNSSTKASVNPVLILQSEPAGKNTASPSATFNLLFANGGAPAETGFYINTNGTLHFSSAQKLPPS